ncbi:MAG: endonuclease [Clostridia bacterium]|nr:endonuclease [Clostridia bacterium]
MKTTQKRLLAVLSALMLMVSVLGSLIVLPVQAATVDYVYSGNYVYNWGEREELATFLSPMAEDFYAGNGVTYDTLSAYSGSSTNSSVPYSALFGELHELMYGNLDNPTSYDATRSLFQYTDCENNGGSISSFYSGNAIGPSWDSGNTWNREHCWPNSKSNSGSNSNTQRETDIMMLRPASVSENSSRSNTAYGESSNFYDPNGLGQKVRGDVARIVLYVYVCWGGSSQHDGALDYMWGSSGVMESKAVLLKWMEEDPVDTWELGRNDSVESITGTRNVFVDYPELAFLLFNEDVPSDYDSPSGEGSGPAYTVSASSNNTAYGTVSVSGKTITATPKTGYAVGGYTILSGSATVTRSGNVFTVVPTSDVSVRINFVPRQQVTIQFAQMSGTDPTAQTAYIDDTITLPAHGGAAPDGYTFLGWVEDEVESAETAPTYYKAGSSYTVSAAATLYALYSYTAEGGSGNSNVFELYSGTLTEGDYLVVYEGGALKAEINSGTRFNYAEVTVENDQIQSDDASLIWHIAPNGNHWTLYNADAAVYAAGNGTKNKGALITSITDYAKWTATGDGTYEFVNVGNKAAGINANLRRNDTYGYACYSTSTGGALSLYKRASGTVYYTTAAACDHVYDNACDTTCNLCGAQRTVPHDYVGSVTTAATCGTDGVKTYTCAVCGDSYTEAIPATGNHSYSGQITTAATCGTDGVKTYTCAVCGDSYTEAIPATGDHSYSGQITTDATCGTDGVMTYTCAVCGDSYTEAIPATGDHAYDNACDGDCNACGTTRTPADHVYTADCDAFCDVCGAERSTTSGGEVTITFDDASKRTEFSTTKQVWVENGITVTNNKNNATSNVADYSDPVRFYKGSQVIVECAGMTEIVFTCSSSTYAAALGTSIGDAATVSGSTVTVAFEAPTDSLDIAATSAQVRVNSITVTVAGNDVEHQYDGACDADCNACGAVREAGEHLYDDEYDVDCNVCGDVRLIEYRVYSDEVLNSAMEMGDGNGGLAFKFEAFVSGAARSSQYVGDLTGATVSYRGVDCPVIALGAVISNKTEVGTSYALMVRENTNSALTVIDVDAYYLLSCDADTCSFAVRVTNVPPAHHNTRIYARPYCVLEYEGEQITLYDEISSATYAEYFVG